VEKGKGKGNSPGKISHKNKKDYSPDDGMPPRNTDWAQTGNNGKMNGQWLPSRLSKKNGREFGKREKIGRDRKKDKKNAGEEEDTESVAVSGYGMPSVGTYDPRVGGYKAFGTIGQGNETIGAMDRNGTKCEDRKMLVTVTAVDIDSINSTNSTNSSTDSNSTDPSGNSTDSSDNHTNPVLFMNLLEVYPSGAEATLNFGTGSFAGDGNGAVQFGTTMAASLAAVAFSLY